MTVIARWESKRGNWLELRKAAEGRYSYHHDSGMSPFEAGTTEAEAMNRMDSLVAGSRSVDGIIFELVK